MNLFSLKSNPWKTVIYKDDNGWFDRDDPGVYYDSRRLARKARRERLGLAPKQPIVAPPATSPLTPLQERALRRLKSVGIADADVRPVVTAFGYNASVSYGHMRVAGAAHGEAREVIDLGDPDISLAYGKLRASGLSHDDALEVACLGS